MSERHPPRLIRRAREINDEMLDTRRALFLVLDLNGELYRERVELRRVVADLSAEALADSDIRAEINRRLATLEREQALWQQYAVAEWVRRYWEFVGGQVDRAWRPLSEVS